MRRVLGRPGAQAVVVGTALLGVLGGAVVATATMAEPRPVRAEAASLADDLPLPRADRSRQVVPEAAVEPQPLQAAPVEVAPLAALAVADVVVRSAAPLDPALVELLRGLKGVTASALLDSGTVDLAGPAALLGADPSELRPFTPQQTAESDGLWQAVARGELAVAPALHTERSLPLGEQVTVSGRPARLGAVASFGLPRADVVVTREAARALGAVPDSVLVLAAPDVRTAALSKAVRKAAGDAVEVELLRPADVAPSALEGRPTSWRELYIDSARYCPGLSWTVLAAIGQVESAHGKHLGPSSAGALGPMQFMPATWAAYGIDGDGDGVADIMNPLDAVPSAARYLCRNGASTPEGLYGAVFAYNRADWYVRKVLGIAAQYR
ncbi:MAG TPA: lytic transglycosylase domain-containing protein [Mycobacteriales bacterium]|nr:lytic transglycosylase domain-containing protein [Mycobacteriales bacterium]